MKGSTVIVYGGSGFLGSHVADELSGQGFKVRVFDRQESPYLKPGQEMIVGDLTDLDAVTKAARGCEYVYNFAGIADIGEAKERPLDTAKVNILGNLHVLEAARQTKSKRFVFASTVYVFSEAGSFYRVSKQAGERFVETYFEQYGLPYTILRYGSLYGRRASEWNGIYTLLRQAFDKKTIVYEGTADAMREYIHVKDAAKLSVKVLSSEYENRHIIITGHERLAVKSIIRMIQEMLPTPVEVKYLNHESHEHYVMSPYSFNPKIGYKLVTAEHIDIGQGLLDCLAGIHEELQKKPQIMGDLLVDEKKPV